MLKNFWFWSFVVAATVAALAGRAALHSPDVAEREVKRVAFIAGGPGDYWQAAQAGAEAAARELGIELDIRTPSAAEDVVQQMQALSVVSASDVDAVAISPIDPEREGVLLTQIAAAKPVVTFDSDASGTARHGYVGTSNHTAGLVTGTLVKKTIPEGGEIAVLMANETKENLQERRGGFEARIAESPVPDESAKDPRYKIVGVWSDNGDNDECANLIRKALDEHPELACLVTLNARQGPVAIKTLEELGKTDQVKLVAFDTPKETLEGIKNGSVAAAVAQDPYGYGYQAIVMCESLARGDRRYMPVVGRGSLHMSVEPVTADNLEDFEKRMKNRRPATDPDAAGAKGA